MRAMTGGACQPSRAFGKTGRLPEPVCMGCDLEFIFTFRARRVIEINRIVAERLTRAERKDPAIPPDNRSRQACAGSFQMTLHADIKLTFRRQARWVEDRFTDLILVSAGSQLNVFASRPVATLAVNSRWNLRWENRLAAGAVSGCCQCGICVVTKHALLRNLPAKVRVIGMVVARVHCPGAPAFRIPRKRQLHQPPVRVSMQECLGMIAGTDHIVNLLLENVDLSGPGTGLMAVLIELAVAFKQRIMTV